MEDARDGIISSQKKMMSGFFDFNCRLDNNFRPAVKLFLLLFRQGVHVGDVHERRRDGA
jgi:hypothetical protein